MPPDHDIRPLIPESSTSEATNVEVVLGDLNSGLLIIPDYQRDSDQWSDITKSLLVESVINNLSIPAFFFEVQITADGEKNDVVDGQQRLTTLSDYFNNRFSLVGSDEAPYLSPNSVHYAGKGFRELPIAYQNAFKRYRLTIIKLRNLGATRLEVFRRINQGGTPLSGQDIRLAYYGDQSPSLAFVRLAGVYAPDSPAPRRFITSAKTQFKLEYPWNDATALELWDDWWNGKEIARGQTPSEMFLWALAVSDVSQLNGILTNKAALQTLNVLATSLTMDTALDALCSQLRFQDQNPKIPPILKSLEELKADFFPYFQKGIELILGKYGPNLPVTKHRIIAAVIGAAYSGKIDLVKLDAAKWNNLIEFIRRPQELAGKFHCEWPASKGRWDGPKGYKTQFEAAHSIVSAVTR